MIFWHPAYEVDIGAHVFPTQKYRRVRERLIAEGHAAAADFVEPEPATDDQVALVHRADYLERIRRDALTPRERQLLEVPFTPALARAMWLSAGGTIAASRAALVRGVAVHLGGGFHHAFPDHGEGFCLIHDVAIAIRTLVSERRIERALIVDLDVHHGNGSAAIFAADAAVFTFSMHQQDNYPARKPPSDLDVGLADGTDDATYLGLLSEHLPRICARHRPQLACYLAGADPYREDQLGGLGLTIGGLARRDRLVFDVLREHRVPVAVTLAGGYAADPRDTVEIHGNTVLAARAGDFSGGAA